ncbi:MAG TPA: chromosomal replication initiator DnaA [Vitreimonas sp.]|uniref:chromosomal replication initiator DnaA n=1 Tax=Vitreimonas sp. TaxID=3069702 RepID=UPI002D5EC43B|nr:chromosomal replication initiator DnaA [Vitreimonas sp.]HYD88368.1 chromosomal replication initiator DnaA [Vitreimonas sp.]
MSEQPRLFEFRMGERSPDTLVVSEANRDAAGLLTDWRSWPGGALALVGPRGAGKTHLALAWALEMGARQLAATLGPDEAAAVFHDAGGRLLIDDADRAPDEAMLWRVLDMARSQGGAVLLTGATAPAEWPVRLPDLRSRLAALPVARLKEPDEALMEVVLRRICREQFILLSDDAAQYLVRRLPRTFAAAQACAAALDAELVRGAKPVSLTSAKKALARMETGRGGEDG